MAGFRRSPASPPVQHTSTARPPSSWYLRTEAGPLDDSSSGWACTVSRRNWSTAPTLARLKFMKVAFVGSLSTGKTTLANLFAREWDYPLLPEVAREVVELGFPLDQTATAETETLIFLKQWRAELLHEKYVADRAIYDVLPHPHRVVEKAGEGKEKQLLLQARGLGA